MIEINNIKLDKEQIKAIKGKEKYKLVVAGAGAGKTLTILGNIKYLIDEKGLKEKEILCISFTNESCNSLKSKLDQLGYNIDVKTFHKLSLNILKKEFKIVDSNYLEYIIDEYFKSYVKNDNKRKRLFKNVFYTDLPIEKIFKSIEYNNLKKTIVTFINLHKARDYGINELFKFFIKSHFNEKTLIKIIFDIYLIYTRELESTKQIDFNDMISLASKSQNLKYLKYKYIIIDEFQDTSPVRFNLIKNIINYTDASLFAVGDDWQSIYRFSGCNLDLFLNFKRFFTNSKIYYLKYTYRNSQELIDTSANFVMKNKSQLKKNIKSNKNILKPIKLCYGLKIEDILKVSDSDTLILARTNKDLEKIKFENKLTIHKSKGLEANDIIIFNSDNLPSKTKSESILRYVLNEKEYFPYEEERRIFYVALTRARNFCYIMINNDESIFIKEIKKEYKDYIEIIKK